MEICVIQSIETDRERAPSVRWVAYRIVDRLEFVTTRRLLVAIASAANSGFSAPEIASGIATPL